MRISIKKIIVGSLFIIVTIAGRYYGMLFSILGYMVANVVFDLWFKEK